MELIAHGTCPHGHDWAVYLDAASEWVVDGGSDQACPDEDREEHPAVTCGGCWAEAAKAVGVRP